MFGIKIKIEFKKNDYKNDIKTIITIITIMSRILLEVNGKKYYRMPDVIYYDMYINDKNKYISVMKNAYKLQYCDENLKFDIYSYYWNPYWNWVEDTYITFSDGELCSCCEQNLIKKVDKYERCCNCNKIIMCIGN